MIPECYMAAGYILNRSPTQRIKYQSPLGSFLKECGVIDWMPNAVHLFRFGCKAYAHNLTRDRLDKLEPKAHIGWLVGWESSNIWRVWIPDLNSVISTQDVRFDESVTYTRNTRLSPEVEEIVRVIEVPELGQGSMEEFGLEDYETSIDAPNDTIQVVDVDVADSMIRPSQAASVVRFRPQTAAPSQADFEYERSTLPTPDGTPEPDNGGKGPSRQVRIDLSPQASPPSPRKLRNQGVPEKSPTSSPSLEAQEQGADISEPLPELGPERQPRMLSSLTNSDGWTKNTDLRPCRHKDAYLAFLDQATDEPQTVPFFHAAFQAGMESKRVLKVDAPAEPKNIKSLKGHRYETQFRLAMESEYNKHKDGRTWVEVSDVELAGKRATPLMWRFQYKEGLGGYISGFKARLCVRGDLQFPDAKDTYAATLAARVFRALLVMCAYFDLDITQYDAISAFTNTDIDELVLCYGAPGFPIPGRVLKLCKALYGLKRAPLL